MRKVGIDLGTTNLLICVDNEGVIVDEPSVLTIDAQTKKCIAAGKEAKEMLGRTPGSMISIRPLKDGVIADFDATEMLLNYFFKQCNLQGMFRKNIILICHPTNITTIEKNAIRDCAYRAGAKRDYLEEEPKVAAVGAGLDIGKACGSMVLDIGGGTSDIAVLSLGDIVCSTSLKVAGNRFTQLIIDYLRKYRKLAIGEQMAEEVKIRIGSALPLDEPLTMKVSGLALDSGLPVTIEVNSNEVESALRSAVDEIVRAVRTVLEITPPELAADIIQRGIVMTGGGSLLQNFDERLRSELQIPVYIAENALHCVVDGCSIMLEQLH